MSLVRNGILITSFFLDLVLEWWGRREDALFIGSGRG